MLFSIKKILVPISAGLLLFPLLSISQEKQTVTSERKIHYVPEGNSFVLKNGSRKFNRALYGTNTAFRVEAGDLPNLPCICPNGRQLQTGHPKRE